MEFFAKYRNFYRKMEFFAKYRNFYRKWNFLPKINGLKIETLLKNNKYWPKIGIWAKNYFKIKFFCSKTEILVKTKADDIFLNSACNAVMLVNERSSSLTLYES